MSDKKPKVKIALKYCGSCNPLIDLPRLARYLADLAARRGEFELVPLVTSKLDAVVILCGCPRACGNKAEIRARAKHFLLIAGENVAGTSVSEANLPELIAAELAKIISRIKG